MLTRLRDRIGTAGLVVAVIALVAAMAGGALAASGALTSKQKKEVQKIAKQYAGKPGAAGPQGPAGPTGAAGAKGDAGAAGADGDNGAPGSAGQSVTSVAEPPGANCPNAGYKLTSASGTSYVCNGSNGAPGAAGAPGAPGSPWTAGGTLPANSTLKGMYSAFSPGATAAAFASISFEIPLAAALDETHAVFVPSAGANPDAAHCAGSAANPTAASGYLCVYEFAESEGTAAGVALDIEGNPGASPMGALIPYEFEEGALPAYAWGSWAVTG